MEETKNKHLDWQRLLVTIVIVVVTAGVSFGITWFILDKSVKESDEASDTLRISMQKQIDELRTKLKSPDESSSNEDKMKYVNEEFGFQMTLPEDWIGYKLLEKTLDESTKTWYVELPTTDINWAKATSTNDAGYVSLFAISAFTDQQWSDVVASEMNSNTLITKIGKYTFAYSHAQASATDISTAKSAAVKQIIQTFKEK